MPRLETYEHGVLIKTYAERSLLNRIKLRTTSNEVVPVSAIMRNHSSELIILVENNPIRSRRTPIVNLPRVQNRELKVLARNREVKAFVVVVLVRIVIDVVVRGLQLVPGLVGCEHRRGSVAVAAAGVRAGVGGFREGGGQGQGGD